MLRARQKCRHSSWDRACSIRACVVNERSHALKSPTPHCTRQMSCMLSLHTSQPVTGDGIRRHNMQLASHQPTSHHATPLGIASGECLSPAVHTTLLLADRAGECRRRRLPSAQGLRCCCVVGHWTRLGGCTTPTLLPPPAPPGDPLHQHCCTAKAPAEQCAAVVTRGARPPK